MINVEDFLKVEMRAGTIVDAVINEKANKPAYVLKIDFGEHGVKTSSAQITQHYQPADLLGKQIIAVMNFPSKKIAGITSEVLVLACVSEEEGTVLLQPNFAVPNGSLVA